MDDIEEPDILVQRLHQIAVRHGLNVKDVAEKCGVPKSSLERYVRLKGAKRPGIDALIMSAKGFDVSIDWLVGRTDGKIGHREIEEYAQRMLLNYVVTESLFSPERFDTFRIFNHILENTDDIPAHFLENIPCFHGHKNCHF